MITGFILFILLGLGLGFAVPGRAAFLALVVPLLFAAYTGISEGFDVGLLIRVVVALALTAFAVIVGQALDRRLSDRDSAPAESES